MVEGEQLKVEQPKAAEPVKAKAKVEIDVEKSQKKQLQDSVVGKLVLSDNVCASCGSPVLDEWTSCAKCGGTKAINKHKYKVPEPETKKTKKK